MGRFGTSEGTTVLIRPQQLATLEANLALPFVQDCTTFLRDAIPQYVSSLTDRDLERRVVSQLDRSRSYGLDSRYSFLLYAILDLVLGPDFDEEATIRQYLMREDVNPDKKMAALASAFENLPLGEA